MRFLMDLFPKILDMSITASIVILIVIAARLLLKKAPKVISYALWGVVLLRLLVPFSIPSDFSLIPERVGSGELVSELSDIYVDETWIIEDDSPYYDAAVFNGREPVTDESGTYVVAKYDQLGEPETVGNTVMPVLSGIWLAGVAAMLVYSVVSYIKLHRQLRVAIPVRDNIFIADDIKSPFVVGFIRPKIYLPGTLGEKEQEYIILHEQHHISRCDHIVKLLSFAALSIHWFNPFVWLAFALSAKDMEMSCDEAVIRKMGEEVRADYSASLLTLATGRRIIAGTPLAFGEGSTESRIKNLYVWRKPVLWGVIAAVIGCGVLAACLLTNPVSKDTEQASPTSGVYSVSEVIYENGSYSLSLVPRKSTPLYVISDTMQLFSQKEYSVDWSNLGILQEFELTRENFDKILRHQIWMKDGSASSLRRNNAKAWELIYNGDRLYYLLQQNNGELYMVYGYYDASEKNDPYSDDTSISWIYKLSAGIFEDTSMVAMAGDKIVPMVTHLNGTDIGLIKNSICWLDVSGYYDTLPFEVFWNGESIHYGRYRVFDAGTYEEIEFFHPSGESAQAFIFHDAQPDREYIIIMKHPTENNEMRYCFGVRLGDAYGSFADVGGGELTDFAYESAYAWVNYSADGYNAMVERAENRDTERRYGNVEHLTPVVMLESKEEFDAFYKEMSAYFSFEQNWDDCIPFSTQAKHYTADFFENNTLFIAYLEEPTTSNRHAIEEVRIEKGVLEIRICRSKPQTGDSAMAGWFLSVGVEKETIADCTGYDAYICAEVDPDSVFPSGEPVGTYAYNGGDLTKTATVCLFDDGQFQFIFSPLSSYIAIGSYTIENNRLMLHTHDGMFVYAFDMVDDTLVFDAEASTDRVWYSGITDGSVFEKE